MRDGERCSIKGCNRPLESHGWCALHYERWQVHGDPKLTAKDPTYISWIAMKQRCQYPKHVKYPEYGGRGITVCDRWASFDNFRADMGERPEGHTLDRINTDGNYTLGNCRWATPLEQARNRRPRRWAKRPKAEVA